MRRLVALLALFIALPAGSALAGTMLVLDGSAVGTADRAATFDAVTDGTDLRGYTEDGLVVWRDDEAFVSFDPTGVSPLGGFSGGFHYGNTGGPVRIYASDGAVFRGLEFNFGNGYDLSNPNGNLSWEASLNGVVTGHGSVVVQRGSVVGFTGAGGFDLLRVSSPFLREDPGALFVNREAIALDNVGVSVVPLPPAAWLGLGLLAGLGAMRQLRRSVER